jgi:plasmid stability protein
MRLEVARSIAEEGDASGAAGSLAALAEGNDPTATAALAELVRLAVRRDAPIPDQVVSDLRVAAMQHRRSAEAVDLRMLLINALATRGELGAALQEARAAVRDFPSEAARIKGVAVNRIAASDPAEVGSANYAEAALSSSDLIAGMPMRHAARRLVARALVELGLPNSAFDMLAPALIADDPAARLIAAEAYIAQASPGAALQMLGGIEGSAAAKLRARSYALEGDHSRAVGALMDEGLHDDVARHAWVSGSWREAQEATDDPERVAMAAYMAARSDPDMTLPRSPAPGTLEPIEALREPVPPLDRPSLDAARRLTAAGPAVAAFMENVLGAE